MRSSDVIKNRLKFLPELNVAYSYQFKSVVTNLVEPYKGHEKYVNRKVEIIYLGTREEYRFFQVLTFKTDIASNEMVENKALLIKLMTIYNYLEIGVNMDGEIKKIFNLEEVYKRMEKVRDELKKSYGGQELDNLFSTLEKQLKDEEKTISLLMSYKMLGLYFTGLFQQFNKPVKPVINRKVRLNDFDNIEVVEEIKTAAKEDNVYEYTISNNSSLSDEPDNINIEYYRGVITTSYNKLKGGVLEIQTPNTNIKYTVAWES